MNKSDILVISTGGTFNKVYNPISGELEIDKSSKAIKKISKRWKSGFRLINIISKDSLEMDKKDRKLLTKTIQHSKAKKIIVIHGTDTIDKSTKKVAKNVNNKIVVFVGSMVPFSIDRVEATANFALGVGFLEASPKDGVYIAMHSTVREWDKIYKDKRAGLFREVSSKK